YTTAVADRAFDQFDWFHGRVEVIHDGFVDRPYIALGTVSAPEMARAFAPAVKNWLILPLVIGPPERKSILGPNKECRPMAAGRGERLIQGVEFRRGHANVDRAIRHCEQVGARFPKK